MSHSGVKAFDHALTAAIPWINDVAEALNYDDRDRACRALRAVLHVLRDRLGVNEAVHLGAQFPVLLRGMYYEGWHAADKPIKMHRDEFLGRIERNLENMLEDPEAVCRGVFAVLRSHVSAGEIRKIESILPQDLKELWS